MKILEQLDIPTIATHTTKNSVHTEDLTQELYLELLEKPTKVLELHNTGDLKRYVYRMAYISYNKYNGNFYKKYRQIREYKPEQATELKLCDILESAELTEMENMWVDIYLDHDCNKKWMQDNTKISRQHIAKRIKEIIEKCKKSL